MSAIRLRSALVLAALLLIGVGCGRAETRRNAQPAAARDSVGTVDFSIVQSALNLLLTRAVEKPTSDRLLSAAWDGLIAEAKAEGVETASAAKPQFHGDARADLADFAQAFAGLTIARRQVLDEAKLNYAAVDSMAVSLDDSHTTFVPPDVAIQLNAREAGNLGTSTGLRLERVTDRPPLVLEVVPDSAASRAGLHAGDTVVALNGRKIGSYTPRQVNRALDGSDGTRIDLDVKSAGSARVRRVTLVRQTTALDLVRSRLLPGKVGYIRIREFPTQVPIQLQVRQALGDFKDAQAVGVIVDLRGNPGGSLGVLQIVMAQFVSQSPLSYLVGRDGRRQAIARSGPFDFTGKLVVLVDDGSASSSELFASAVQEYGDGLIVGQKTCGCLMAAQFYPLADEKSRLEVALERVLSPVKQQQVEKAGVVPDREVAPDPRVLAQGRDPQLEAGLIALGVDPALARTAEPVVVGDVP